VCAVKIQILAIELIASLCKKLFVFVIKSDEIAARNIPVELLRSFHNFNLNVNVKYFDEISSSLKSNKFCFTFLNFSSLVACFFSPLKLSQEISVSFLRRTSNDVLGMLCGGYCVKA
jgi:hypothetical protein